MNEWLNDQLKQLDKVYEEKLLELKQGKSEIEQRLKNFKQDQRLKIINAKNRLFTPEINKQINSDRLKQMKKIIHELHEDIQQFQANECSITLVNNDQMNYSYKPNVEIRLKKKISDTIENISVSDNDFDQGSIIVNKNILII